MVKKNDVVTAITTATVGLLSIFTITITILTIGFFINIIFLEGLLFTDLNCINPIETPNCMITSLLAFMSGVLFLIALGLLWIVFSETGKSVLDFLKEAKK